MEDAAVGDLVAGRYRLERLLGRGGMGNVWAADDARLKRPVAVKVLRAEVAEQTGVRGRFEREARMAAQVNHHNAVAVYDSGEHRGVPYLVMERLPGRTLADEEDEGPLSEARVLELAQQILGAVGAAHAAGVIHRDLKPANVLLTGSGDAKVGDFGIATIGEASGLTATGTVIGTATYLSPERLQGQVASPTTDLYAVGVMLFEALAGRKPFPVAEPLALLHAMTTADPPPVSSLREGTSPRTDAALSWALARDPAARPQTCAELADALGATDPAQPEAGPPIAPSSPSPGPPLATGAETVAEQAPAAPPTAIQSTSTGPGGTDRRRALAVLLGLLALVLAVGVAWAIATRPEGTTTTPDRTTLTTSAPSSSSPTSGRSTTAATTATSTSVTTATSTATSTATTTATTTTTTSTTTAPPDTGTAGKASKVEKPKKSAGG